MALAIVTPARAQNASDGMLRQVKFDQNLDGQVPLEIALFDEEGRAVRLGDYFGKKPVILTLVYYNCPMLCTEVLNALVRSLKIIPYSAGDQFDIVTVSIHPRETPALATAKKSAYLKRYARVGAGRGWHFLTGPENSIKRLSEAVGFHYVYDAKSDQFAHPSGIVVLTPKGRIARYFYGIDYPSRDLQLGLVEASQGKIGSFVDQILLICYHYDPVTGQYTFAIMNIIRTLGVATVLSLATFMLIMFRRDRRKAPLDRVSQGRAVQLVPEPGSVPAAWK